LSKFLKLANSHVCLHLLMYNNYPPHLNYATTCAVHQQIQKNVRSCELQKFWEYLNICKSYDEN